MKPHVTMYCVDCQVQNLRRKRQSKVVVHQSSRRMKGVGLSCSRGSKERPVLPALTACSPRALAIEIVPPGRLRDSKSVLVWLQRHLRTSQTAGPPQTSPVRESLFLEVHQRSSRCAGDPLLGSCRHGRGGRSGRPESLVARGSPPVHGPSIDQAR